jgi:hypothetical protein
VWSECTIDIPSTKKVWIKKMIIEELIAKAPAGQEIADACDEIKQLLLEKNVAYGNSALSPIRIFSKAETNEQLYVRIDDKLNRLKNNQSYPGDNDIDDLIGYLVLLKVANQES